MNIEVGEFVRTKKGNIGKVLDITTCTGQKRKKYLIKWNIVKAYYITGTTIVKHSPNIIDLIEEGDYVNGNKVHSVDYSTSIQTGEKYLVIDKIYQSVKYFYEKDIKSIATKEMMESVEHRVE